MGVRDGVGVGVAAGRDVGVAVADGAEVAVGVEVASEPQPAATRPRTSSRDNHPALLINESPPEILVKDGHPKGIRGNAITGLVNWDRILNQSWNYLLYPFVDAFHMPML